ncbi:MAG: xanthine dehydrogenase family protein molybdopterin-binding subunit [Actinomycetota bacterium]
MSTRETTTRETITTRMVGRSVPFRGAELQVTGKLKYLTDLRLPNMLHGKVVRSEIPHGHIRGIDVSAARKVPGVVAVLTADDVPNNVGGIILEDWPILAKDHVRQVGDAFALVAAETVAAAEAGARAVKVDIEPLPVVDSPERALDPDAPSLHEAGNLLVEMGHEKGDVESALARADLVIDRVFETPSQEHVCLEPGGGVGVYEDGRFTIYVGAQWPQIHVKEVARAMNVEPGDVRVISTPIGGAFGSKTDGPLAVHLALLAKATGRPVRIVLSREEVMASGAKRHPFEVRIRLGLTGDGTILALDTDALVDTGPYATVGMVVLKVAAELCTGAYRVENARFHGRVAYTNNGNGGAFRGYGAPQAQFPLEMALNLAAAQMGIDPVELRRRNVLRVGDEHGMYGQTITPGLMVAEALEAVAAHRWWQEREQWKAGSRWPWRRGAGIALAIKGVGLGSARDDASAARLAISADGSLRIWAGPNHSGQAIDTAYAQIAADVLGRPYDAIEVIIGDTELVPDAGSCAASRSTYMGGMAVKLACEELMDRIRGLGLPAPIDWTEAGRLLGAQGKALVESRFILPDVSEGITREMVEKLSPHLVYGSAAMAARVEVNELTGEVAVRSVASAVDCGVAVNPAGVIGQTEGGVVQGIGWAIMEDYKLENGIPRTSSLETYLIPTADDAPEMDTILVEEGDPTGPFGAKGIAEVVIVPPAPAVASAIADAVGITVTGLPATPERVYRLMQEAAEKVS